MTDINPTDETALAEEEKEGKGKKGKGEAGAAGRSETSIADAAYADMISRGISMADIKGILSNWRHMRGEGLTRSLMEFARGMTRASAHAQVEIAPGKDFSLIHNIVQHFKGLNKTPEHKHMHTLKDQHKPGL